MYQYNELRVTTNGSIYRLEDWSSESQADMESLKTNMYAALRRLLEDSGDTPWVPV